MPHHRARPRDAHHAGESARPSHRHRRRYNGLASITRSDDGGWTRYPPAVSFARTGNRFHIAGVVNRIDIMVGAELDEYIEGSFETKLVDEGFAPVDALNPTNSVNPVEVKTVLVTIQSVSITNLDAMFSPPMASILPVTSSAQTSSSPGSSASALNAN
jgi:hypothetical protein